MDNVKAIQDAIRAMLLEIYPSATVRMMNFDILDEQDRDTAMSSIKVEDDSDDERNAFIYVHEDDTLEGVLEIMLSKSSTLMRVEIERHLLEKKRVQPSLFDSEVIQERNSRSL